MFTEIIQKFETKIDGPGINNRLHWTTVVSEKLVLAVIGALTMGAVILELVGIWERKSITLPDLFLLFIFAEIIGMVGAFYVSRRIPVTLPIIIAITALCRLLISQGKDMDPLILIAASAAILILAAAAYLMSLKDKLSLEKDEAKVRSIVQTKAAE